MDVADLPWWVWGLVAAGAVGGYYYISSSSQSAADAGATYNDSSTPLGNIALSPPLASSGGIGGVGIPDTSSSSLDALTSAISALNAGPPAPSDAVQLAQINANQLSMQASEGTSVFQSLIKSLTAHAGMNSISANIPGLGGVVSVYKGKPVVTKTVTVTKPSILSFIKGTQKTTVNAVNTGRINQLIKQGYKAA